jgi:drug/metabolite transporter (DMT)-like permease
MGEIAALAAAALWATSSLFYSQVRLTAWQLNFGKNLLASGLLLAHLTIATRMAGSPLFQADLRTAYYLVFSSITGILIGDTLYFRSLQILGPRRALIVSTTAPLFGTAIGWLVLDEPLSQSVFWGVLVTFSGILTVVSDSRTQTDAAGHFPGSVMWGVLYGLGGAVCNAVGAAFSHVATAGAAAVGSSGCDALEATVIRVCAAATLSLIPLLVSGQLPATARAAFAPQTLRTYAPAVICGPWLGIWMSQVAYRESLLAVAITLTNTTPLFVIPLMRLFLGTPITLRALAGASLALAGIYFTVSDVDQRPPAAAED